jgi:hypothetical protein
MPMAAAAREITIREDMAFPFFEWLRTQNQEFQGFGRMIVPRAMQIRRLRITHA